MNKRSLRKACSIEGIASLENLMLAAARARKGKSRRPSVLAWFDRAESHLARLSAQLVSGTWNPGEYHFFEITEPKRRKIAAAPFEDRVVHHALCNHLQPLLERRFIARSFSCQKGKGTQAARLCCRELTNRYRYVLKCDVHKFFHQIDHQILRSLLSRQVRCDGTLGLIDKILGSYSTKGDPPPDYFPGDDLFTPFTRPRGLPIGNLTSQLWGNFYLDYLDHGIVETWHHGDYLRYTDDFLTFSDDKAFLWDLMEYIQEILTGLRLKLSFPKSRLLSTREGVPFCGFRFFPGLEPRILGATKRRFERRRHRLYRAGVPIPEISLGIYNWYQFSREANHLGLLKAYSQWPLDGAKRRRRRRGKEGVEAI